MITFTSRWARQIFNPNSTGVSMTTLAEIKQELSNKIMAMRSDYVRGLRDSVAFFYKNAGYGYDPKKETRKQGRLRGAIALMIAEEKVMQDGMISFNWDVDPDIDSSVWNDEKPAYPQYCCTMYRKVDWAKTEVVGHLGGVDFGRNGDPSSDEHQGYVRVVEAEIALEYFD